MKKIKKINNLFLITLILCIFLTISAASAIDNNTVNYVDNSNNMLNDSQVSTSNFNYSEVSTNSTLKSSQNLNNTLNEDNSGDVQNANFTINSYNNAEDWVGSFNLTATPNYAVSDINSEDYIYYVNPYITEYPKQLNDTITELNNNGTISQYMDNNTIKNILQYNFPDLYVKYCIGESIFNLNNGTYYAYIVKNNSGIYTIKGSIIPSDLMVIWNEFSNTELFSVGFTGTTTNEYLNNINLTDTMTDGVVNVVVDLKNGTNLTISNISVTNGILGDYNFTYPNSGNYNATIYYNGEPIKTGLIISDILNLEISPSISEGASNSATGALNITVSPYYTLYTETGEVNEYTALSENAYLTINGIKYPIVNNNITYYGTYPNNGEMIEYTYLQSIPIVYGEYNGITYLDLKGDWGNINHPVLNTSISKTANVTNVFAGKDYIQYNITVFNNNTPAVYNFDDNNMNLIGAAQSRSGYYDLAIIKVTDNLDLENQTFIAYSMDNGTTWNTTRPDYYMIYNLWQNQNSTILINVSVNSNARYNISNTAYISFPYNNDTNYGVNNSTTNVKVSYADLYIQQTASSTTPYIGDKVIFTITVGNDGTYNTTGVTVKDILPNGLGYVSDDSNGSYNSTSGVWTINNLNISNVKTLHITSIVNTAQTLINSANITCNEPESDLTNNNMSTTLNVQVKQDFTSLEISQISNVTRVSFNDSVLYTITVKNIGSITAHNIVITDKIPSALTNAEYYSEQTWKGFNGAYNIPDLASGASATLLLCGTYTPDSNITQFTNTAIVTSSDDPNSHQSSLTIYEDLTDLSINKSVNNTTPSFGDTITYLIIVVNNGQYNVSDVQVSEKLPEGLVFLSSNSTNYNTTSSIWSIGNLTPGESEILAIYALVNKTGFISNFVNVSSHSKDINITNNYATSNITVNPIIDLSIVKVCNLTSSPVNGKVSYLITVTNNGPNNATSVIVNEFIPSGLTYFNDDSNGLFNSSTGKWSIGDLSNGESKTLTLTFIVNCKGEFTNIANVTANEMDINITNNIANATLIGKNVADLIINETVNNSSVKVGEKVLWTVTVTNNGPDNDTDVFVKHISPLMKYLSSTASRGYYNETTDTWNIGNLNVGETVTLTINSQAVNTGNYSLFTNVTGDENESNYENNYANLTVTITNITSNNTDTINKTNIPVKTDNNLTLNKSKINVNIIGKNNSINGSLTNQDSNSSLNSNGISMSKTGNSILVLLLVLSILVGIRPYRKK